MRNSYQPYFEETAIKFGLINEAELSYKQKKNLPDSVFVFPDERKYPIPDEAHARNALARVSQFGTPEEKKKVRSAVKSKFPGINISED